MKPDYEKENLGAIIRHMHWLIKEINQYQAGRQYSRALEEANALEREVWKIQQILRNK
jgi:hypothetical protein